jgi:hypothetical protein
MWQLPVPAAIATFGMLRNSESLNYPEDVRVD